MMRIALHVNALTPYRIPLFNLLSKTGGWRFRVFYDAFREKNRLWNIGRIDFDAEQTSNFSIKTNFSQKDSLPFSQDNMIYLPFGALINYMRYKPDVIISSEMGMRSAIAILYKLLTRTPVIIWSGVTKHTERNVGRFKSALRKFIASHADAWLAYSAQAMEYIQTIGVNRNKIFMCYNCVNNKFFTEKADIIKNDKHAIKKKLGLNRLVFLFVGSLYKLKGLDRLLESWRHIPPEVRKNKASLLLIGSGDQEASLKRTCREYRLGEVHFIHHVQQDELTKYYGISDILIFPTIQDVWGLVVNEAMASGLPCLVSKYAGCATDLIVEGENGFVFDPTERIHTTNMLTDIIQGRISVGKMGQYAKKHISKININEMADKFKKAVLSIKR